MPYWKALLLGLYYHGSMPLRWWNRTRFRLDHRMPISVLCYHRVANLETTPWTMSNRKFDEQIRWLQRNFELISLGETVARVRLGVNDRPAVSITFDDGYSDNCNHAIPLLIREKIPCTYFVTGRNILERQPFPHDLAWRANCAPNTIDQIKAMADAGIEIGSHSMTHPDIGTIHDAATLRTEVVESAEAIQSAIGRQVRYFAFPYGHPANLNRDAFAIAAEAGYEAVCSAYGGFNFPGDDPFHIQRIALDSVMIRTKNWLTFDPRKLRTPRYEWSAGDARDRVRPSPVSGPEARFEEQQPAEIGR